MKFRVERDALAEAVAWTARSLPPRPAVPVLGGVLMEVDDTNLSVSGFDYEVSTQVDVLVHSSSPGRALVSGRLLANITRALPAHPVDVAVDGARVTISCGSARFTLPTMPVEDYPSLPAMPETAGTVPSDVFAAAVAQVAVAAGRDDNFPMLTGVHMQIEGERLTLAATDRYRLAVRELTWKPEQSDLSQAVLVPARTVSEAAKTLVSDGPEVTLALSDGGAGEGIIGFVGAGRRTTTRLLDREFPRYQSLWPSEFSGAAEVTVAPFLEAVKRVSLMAERGTPVRLAFEDSQVTLSAGGDDEGRAEEQLEVALSGDPITVAFNPAYLLDGLSALATDVAVLSFATAIKPAVITGKRGGDEAGDGTEGAEGASGGGPAGQEPAEYRYLLMPVRLPG